MIEIPEDDDTTRALRKAVSGAGALDLDALLFVSWWLYRQRYKNPHINETEPLSRNHTAWSRYNAQKPHPDDVG